MPCHAQSGEAHTIEDVDPVLPIAAEPLDQRVPHALHHDPVGHVPRRDVDFGDALCHPHVGPQQAVNVLQLSNIAGQQSISNNISSSAVSNDL